MNHRPLDQGPQLAAAADTLVTGQRPLDVNVPAAARVVVAEEPTHQQMPQTVADSNQSFAYLANHAAELLTERAEATLEHLIDANPWNPVRVQHLTLLRAARDHGIDRTKQQVLDNLNMLNLEDRLDSWIEIPDWTASVTYLTEHADDLLTDRAEALLASAIPRPRAALRRHTAEVGIPVVIIL